MKKRSLLILTLVIASMVMMIACGPSEGALVGTWVANRGGGVKDTLTLKEDNTYTQKVEGGEAQYLVELEGKWSATEDKLTLDPTTVGAEKVVCTYSLSGSKLILFVGPSPDDVITVIYTKQ